MKGFTIALPNTPYTVTEYAVPDNLMSAPAVYSMKYVTFANQQRTKTMETVSIVLITFLAAFDMLLLDGKLSC